MTSAPKLKPSPLAYSFEAIGTHWTIEFYQPVSNILAIKRSIADRIEDFDQAYSRFRTDSIVTQMATQAGKYQLPDDAVALMALYQKLYELTDGAMTPLIGDVMVAAGYDAAYSLQPKQLKAPLSWGEAMDFTGTTLTMHKPVMLDFGAAGKGYLLDIVADMLRAHGIEAFCIDAGGDIVVNGPHALNIGLEHPDNISQVIGVAQLRGRSICGSAGNRRSWHDFHHIISPHTLSSPKHIKALWVIADTGLIADGLATALYFAPAERFISHFDFEYAIMYEDYSLERSDNFPAQFFEATA